MTENLLNAAPPRTQAFFYRTAAGAEIDLVLDMGAKRGLWAIEIKRSAAAKIEKGFRHAQEDIAPKRSFIVHANDDRYPKGDGVEGISLIDLTYEIRAP